MNKPKVKAKRKRKVNKNVVLIKNLVDIPDPAPKFFWSKETKFAKIFLKDYGDDLLKLSLPYKLKSIAFLGYMKDLKALIERSVLLSQYQPAEHEVVELSDKKSGKDVIIRRKPKNIREWLDH